MTGQLTDAGEHGWLEGHERGVRQHLDLIQDREDHVGPGLRRKIDMTSNMHKRISVQYKKYAIPEKNTESSVI